MSIRLLAIIASHYPDHDPLMTALIWDIQEEHLDETEFLLEAWTSGVDSYAYTLSTLAAGPERRLLARSDALLSGGNLVVDRLLLPVLANPDADEFRTAATTLTILRGAGLEACARVLQAFERAGEVGRRGLVRGLRLSNRAGLIEWLGHDLDSLTGPSLASRLRVLAGHRVDAGARLLSWLRADDLEVRRAAAYLARHTSAVEVLRELAAAMRSEDDALRCAAIESGLVRAVPSAWALTCQDACSPARRRSALAWVARLGDQSAHQRLLTELCVAPTPALLWAAGLTGRPSAVDVAITLLDHPELARLAGEVVCAIAGLSTSDNRFWLDRGATIGASEADGLPELQGDLDRELVPALDDRLRLPNPEAIRSWWAQRRTQLRFDLRHVDGSPLDLATLARSLLERPMRRRHSLATELAARTWGRAQIETRALTATQRAQTEACLASLSSLDLQAGLPLAA